MSCRKGRASSALPRERLGHRGPLCACRHSQGRAHSVAGSSSDVPQGAASIPTLSWLLSMGRAPWGGRRVGPAWAGPRGSSAQPACASLAGQLAAGTCEIVTLDRDSSQPRRTIARQTARCACRKGQIAGTTRARPACVDGKSPGPPGAGPRPSRTFLPGPLFAGWNLQQAPWAACRSGAWGTVVPTWPEDVPWPVRLLWAEWSEVLP